LKSFDTLLSQRPSSAPVRNKVVDVLNQPRLSTVMNKLL